MKRETAPRFAGIGGHYSHAAGTVEWLTPPSILNALGGADSFDLDPASPIEQPYPTSRSRYTSIDNGLAQPWFGRVWLNPPYANGVIELWLSRLAQHGSGTALIFARTETDAFFRHVWERATAVLFMRGRINFHVGEGFSIVRTRKTFWAGDRADGNAGAPTVLCAYGTDDAERLADSGIDGRFVPLIFDRSVLVSLFAPSNEKEKSVVTWRELVAGVLREADGPVRVDAVWRIVREHPKASGRPHARAKVRQILQMVGERVERGQYRLAV